MEKRNPFSGDTHESESAVTTIEEGQRTLAANFKAYPDKRERFFLQNWIRWPPEDHHNNRDPHSDIGLPVFATI